MQILYDILNQKQNRQDLINTFQNYIWRGNEFSKYQEINEILDELAYDLDFYEPNEEYRKEDFSFYGDEKLEIIINDALLKIEAILRNE